MEIDAVADTQDAVRERACEHAHHFKLAALRRRREPPFFHHGGESFQHWLVVDARFRIGLDRLTALALVLDSETNATERYFPGPGMLIDQELLEGLGTLERVRSCGSVPDRLDAHFLRQLVERGRVQEGDVGFFRSVRLKRP